MINFIRKNWFLIAIVTFITLIKVIRVPYIFSFGIDEEYQANLAWWIVKDFKAIWIGVSAANTGFYLGPGFTYLNALLFWISNGDPLILGYFSVLLSTLTILSLYFVVSKLFSKKSALLALVLYSFSSLMIGYDLRFWNPSFIPIVSIWLVYSLIQSYKNSKWLILSTILIASSLHVHLSLLIYWPLFIYSLVKNIKKISLSSWGIGIVSYVLVVSPLIVYDVNHNFDNLKTPIRMLSSLNRESLPMINHLNSLLLSLGNIWLPGNLSLLLSCLSITFLILFFVKEKGTSKKIISFAILIYVLAFLFYPGYPNEYYLLGLFTLVFLVSGVVLSKLKTKLVPVFIFIFSAINLYRFLSIDTSSGLLAKKIFIETVSTKINEPYRLDTVKKYRDFAGWRYLFSVYGKTPVQSDADNLYGWIYQEEISKDKPTLKVIISDSPISTDSAKPDITSGGFFAQILPNN